MYWHRAIILVDLDAFFAAIEQHDNPHLRGRPVGITNGKQGTCLITCSYEARLYGVKTGMRLKDALKLCPALIQIPSHPERYADASRRIMSALSEQVSPIIEVFSVDEAFLDVTGCQRLFGHPAVIGQKVKTVVYEASGLVCSVGVSGDKTTVKYAAKLNKPDGFAVIPPWDTKNRLAPLPVTELCGINVGVARFLARYGAYTCGDVGKLPIHILAKRFGNIGRRIWLMCQGQDPDPIHMNVPPPKSMGHGKVMPPNTRDPLQVRTYLLHMATKLGTRLRKHNLQAQSFFMGVRHLKKGWLGTHASLSCATHDSQIIYQLGLAILNQCWDGEPVMQIQVTALDPKPAHMQYDFFETFSLQKEKLHRVIDTINQRYGEFAIAPATLLMRSTMNNVIAPAWKPFGHRQTL